MISLREASLALSGAFRLARFDANGALFFVPTVASFWNSFWVLAAIIPLHTVLLALVWQVRQPDVSLTYFIAIDIAASAVSWLGFFLVMFHISEWIGRGQRFLSFAIATNWTSLCIAALVIPVEIASLTGILTGDLLSLFLAVGFLYRFLLPWFVARHALNLSVLGAFGVVMLDVLIMVIITTITYPMMFPG